MGLVYHNFEPPALTAEPMKHLFHLREDMLIYYPYHSLPWSQLMGSGELQMMHHLVAAFIVRRDRILLGQRSPDRLFYPSVWDVFGGHIEPGEQPEQTLIREVKEELGIIPTHWTDLGIIKDSLPEHDLVACLFCVTAWTGTPRNRQPEEHSVIEWFSFADAAKLDLAHPAYPQLFAQCLQVIS